MGYKIVSECNRREVWGLISNVKRALDDIKEGYHHRHMYAKDKHKVLILIDDDGKVITDVRYDAEGYAIGVITDDTLVRYEGITN